MRFNMHLPAHSGRVLCSDCLPQRGRLHAILQVRILSLPFVT